MYNPFAGLPCRSVSPGLHGMATAGLPGMGDLCGLDTKQQTNSTDWIPILVASSRMCSQVSQGSLMSRRTRTTGPQLFEACPLRFDQKLVLNQWLISLFEVPNLEKLAEWLRNPELEGFDAENVSRFCNTLSARIFDREACPATGCWPTIGTSCAIGARSPSGATGSKAACSYPKYFQYLALLFTEIYLDRYFRDRERLLTDLNVHVAAFNAEAAPDDRLSPFQPEDLNKICVLDGHRLRQDAADAR